MKKILIFSPTLITSNAFFSQGRMFHDIAENYDISICCHIDFSKGTDVTVLQNAGFTSVFGVAISPRNLRMRNTQLQINTFAGKKYSRICEIVADMHKPPFFQVSMHLRRLVFSIIGGCSWLAKLSNRCIESYLGVDDNILAVIRSVQPDIIITFSTGFSYLEYEAIKAAKHSAIPIIGLQYGWDSMPNHGIRPFMPDYVGVWGYQSRIYAEKMHQVPPERIFHIGAPFADKFREQSEKSVAEILTELGLPTGRKVLFYVGSAWAFNEVRLLKLLDDAIQAGMLKDCCIFFRPHPFRHISQGDLDYYDQRFKHVYLDPMLAQKFKLSLESGKAFPFDKEKVGIDFEHTKNILSISSVIIASLSTMIVQGALLGVPSVAFTFVDKENERYWRRCEYEHLELIRAMPGVTICGTPVDLVKCCQRSLESSQDKQLVAAMKKHVELAIYDDSLTYSQRLQNAINAILSPNENSIFNFLSDPVLNVTKKQNVIKF